MLGFGFGTETEVALLFMASGAVIRGLLLYAILCLPVLFAAGMSLLDTIDGTFMNFRVWLGLLQADQEGLLQRHYHRAVRRRRADHRHDRIGVGPDRQARAQGQLLGCHLQPRPQRDRACDRWAVRRHLGDRDRVLAGL
jgi:hypothetical protein